MNFTADLASRVLERKKTQTRRRRRDGEEACRYRPGRIYPVERPAYKDEMPPEIAERVRAGRTRRPSTVVGYLEVDATRPQQLGEIAFADVLAEGFRTTATFKAWWVRHYDPLWVHRQDENLDDSALVARFDSHHAEVPVWAITFHLTAYSPPKLLAVRSELGYVDRHRDSKGREISLPDEPEAVDDELWLRDRATAARANLAEHRATVAAEEQAACELLELHERLRRAQILAGKYGIDVSRDLFVIGQRVEKLEASLRQQSAA